MADPGFAGTDSTQVGEYQGGGIYRTTVCVYLVETGSLPNYPSFPS